MNVFKIHIDATLTIAHQLAMTAACQLWVNRRQLFLVFSAYDNCHKDIKSIECISLNLEMYLLEDSVRKIVASVKVEKHHYACFLLLLGGVPRINPTRWQDSVKVMVDIDMSNDSWRKWNSLNKT